MTTKITRKNHWVAAVLREGSIEGGGGWKGTAMIWAAFESQTDLAAAESSGQDRSIRVIEGWRRRKSDIIGSVLTAAGGRVEGAAG
jgi:hypothetical protein